MMGNIAEVSPTPKLDELTTLVTTIVRSLVDDPEDIWIELIRLRRPESGESLVYRISAPHSEVGKLIGRQGRTARALRMIMCGAGAKHGVRCQIDLQEVA